MKNVQLTKHRKGLTTDKGKKRQYAPFTLTADCDCGEKCEYDFSMDYLSYPTFGEPCQVEVYCPECEVVFLPTVVLDLTMELVE